MVASVPSAHPYVAHLEPVHPSGADPAVVRLPDPDPDHPDRPAEGRWWPPAMLEASWVREHDLDLMHVHFGVDGRTPAQLTALVGALRERRRPLVLTLHDLRSPHQADRRVLDEQLDVLVPAADALLTLTPGAAAETAQRWGRDATVVPHPHLVDLDVVRRVRGRRAALPTPPGPARVGLSLKSLRANVDPLRLLEPLCAVEEARLVVSVHRSWWDGAGPGHPVRRALQRAAARDDLELLVHEPMPDTALWEHVAGLDAAVLPYRFGTHSGWLEMCHDLGTSVVAPSLGHYTGQGVEATYLADEEHVDEASVRDAVRQVLRDRRQHGLPGLDADARAAQRDEVAAVHRGLYARLVSRAGREVA